MVAHAQAFASLDSGVHYKTQVGHCHCDCLPRYKNSIISLSSCEEVVWNEIHV